MLYLASTSPRRHWLLNAAGIEFTAVAPGPEVAGEGSPLELATIRARSKAMGAVVEGVAPVLGVDTVVDRDGEEIGKPRDEDHAREILARLAGRVHRVHTALCLRRQDDVHERIASAEVRFGDLPPARLDAFLAAGAWQGKAGGYGIQDAECDFAELVAGDVETVIGLPVAVLREMLEELAR